MRRDQKDVWNDTYGEAIIDGMRPDLAAQLADDAVADYWAGLEDYPE